MFYWIDYDENTALFIQGRETSIAILRYKDFRLTDAITDKSVKIQATSLEKAKIKSEKYLVDYWRRLKKETTKIFNVLG